MANIIGIVFGVIGALTGIICAIIIIIIEWAILRRSARQIAVGLAGLAGGLVVANLVSCVIAVVFKLTGVAEVLLFAFGNLALGYIGAVVAVRKGGEITSVRAPSQRVPSPGAPLGTKILDTSVLIDGRIADIGEARFLEGVVMIPRFVVQELQYIADSHDDLKRARGRRGLDIVKRLQSQEHLSVQIEDVKMSNDEKVDSKLVRLAQERGASIITTDYNLNKVADLHGVTVLNINDLAKALKPVFLAGEEIEVRLLKRGKEPGQGVGYLDDGTMVVVDEGSTKLGRSVVSVVTSVLQTTAGRMVFARLKK
jgi:uncharacterized protein YacL